MNRREFLALAAASTSAALAYELGYQHRRSILVASLRERGAPTGSLGLLVDGKPVLHGLPIIPHGIYQLEPGSPELLVLSKHHQAQSVVYNALENRVVRTIDSHSSTYFWGHAALVDEWVLMVEAYRGTVGGFISLRRKDNLNKIVDRMETGQHGPHDILVDRVNRKIYIAHNGENDDGRLVAADLNSLAVLKTWESPFNWRGINHLLGFGDSVAAMFREIRPGATVPNSPALAFLKNFETDKLKAPFVDEFTELTGQSSSLSGLHLRKEKRLIFTHVEAKAVSVWNAETMKFMGWCPTGASPAGITRDPAGAVWLAKMDGQFARGSLASGWDWQQRSKVQLTRADSHMYYFDFT